MTPQLTALGLFFANPESGISNSRYSTSDFGENGKGWSCARKSTMLTLFKPGLKENKEVETTLP